MKLSLPIIILISGIATLLAIPQQSNAQLWKKIRNEVKNRVENRAVNESGNATDDAMDKAKQVVKNDTKDNTDNTPAADENGGDKESVTTMNSPGYKNYDFVPGDKIIFEPDLSTESDAELPARFIIKSGTAEIQSYQGEKILHMGKASRELVSPLMSSDHYLPEQFTLEFDLMYENEGTRFAYVNGFDIQFCSRGDGNYSGNPLYKFHIESNTKCTWGPDGSSNQPFPPDLVKSMSTNNTWHHLAIYIRKNIGKAYLDGYRVAASNNMPVSAGYLILKGDSHYGFKIKNFRLAAGGDDKYNKIITDGKFISHGILFRVNQSTIKPESMGAINEIVKLLKEHADLKLEIDGHTDIDGNADENMKLSKQRAEAVKSKLIENGIDESRLTTKGYGASKPIDDNKTAEGKANNRRVEFVKL